MKQIAGAVRYNFMGFFKSPRSILAFCLSLILCFLLSEKSIEAAKYFHSTMQAAEPFIWTFGDSTAILLSSLLLLFLFSDLPKITPFTPFYLMRITKRKWMTAQILYVVLGTVIYVGFVLTVTMLLCAKYTFLGNMWSHTAAALGYSSMGKDLQIPSTVKVMESISPYGCMVQVVLLLLGYALTLGFLILLGNLSQERKYGMFLGAGYSLYGFLLDPKVLGKIMGMEEYEMYRGRSLAGWISPLNQAVYGMHDFGYDNLPSIRQSLLFFLLILLFLGWLCRRKLKSYNFTFKGGQ